MHITLSGVTTPYSLSTVLPASKPPRPGWVVPVLVTLAVVALAGIGFGTWALLRPTSALPATVATTPTTVAPAATLPLGGQAATACRQLDLATLSSLTAMQAIGAIAATSSNDSIRIAGALLHDRAELAIAGQAAHDPNADQEAGDVVSQARALRAACVKEHYLAS